MYSSGDIILLASLSSLDYRRIMSPRKTKAVCWDDIFVNLSRARIIPRHRNRY